MIHSYNLLRKRFATLLFLLSSVAILSAQDILVTVEDETCPGTNDGSLTLEVVGELAPYPGYEFNWSLPDGTALPETGYVLTDLQPGAYCIEVISPDNCIAYDCFTIQPSSVHIDVSLTATTCICAPDGYGGIEINITGGTPPYSYSWNGPNNYASDQPSPTDITEPGTYTVLVGDANGCTESQGFSVGVCNLPVFSHQVSQSCDGPGTGEISIQMIEPVQSPYIFQWTLNGIPYSDVVSDLSTGTSTASNLAVGEYCVTVFTSNGCSAFQCWDIESTDMPTINYVVGPEVNGNDGFIDLIVSGAGPFIFDWSNGATTEDLFNITAGNYDLQLYYDQDQNCLISLPFTVYSCSDLTASVSLSAAITASTTSLNQGAIDLTVDGADGYEFKYQWSTGSDDEDIAGLAPGTYCVTVTHNDCPAFSVSDCFEVCNFDFSIVPFDSPAIFGCEEIQMIADMKNGVALSYLWNTGETTPSIYFQYDQEYCVTITDDSGCEAMACRTVPRPQMSFTLDVTNASLGVGNGAIDLTVSGGWPLYSFLWSNGATTEDLTNIPSGEYCVTITDQCESITACTYVSCEVAPEEVAANITGVSCATGTLGSISLDLSGVQVLNPSFQFQWSNGATTQNISNLPAGSYCVGIVEMITQCYVYTCFEVPSDEEDPFDITFDQEWSCQSGATGSITANVSGGNSPYTYLWSNGATTATAENLAGGWHVLTVTDAAGCTEVDYTFLWATPSFDLTGTIDPNPICDNQTAIISVTPSGGTPPYTYEWRTCCPWELLQGETSAQLEVTEPGYYYALATDASGCSREASFLVEDHPGLSIDGNFNVIQPSGCNSNDGAFSVWHTSINVIGGTPPYSYLWSNGATTFGIENLAPGTYTLTVTDATGCSGEFVYELTTDAQDPVIFGAVQPSCENLSNGEIQTFIWAESFNYSVLWNTGATAEDLTDLNPGTYCLTVTDLESLCETSKCFSVGSEINNGSITLSVNVEDNCEGAYNDGSILLQVSGGNPPYTFSWDQPGIWNTYGAYLPAGIYCVTVTDHCENIATGCYTINSYQPAVSFSVTNTCENVSMGAIDLNISGFPDNPTYQWSNGKTTQDISQLSGGTYCVTVNSSFCNPVTECVTVQQVPLEEELIGWWGSFVFINGGWFFEPIFCVKEVLCNGEVITYYEEPVDIQSSTSSEGTCILNAYCGDDSDPFFTTSGPNGTVITGQITTDGFDCYESEVCVAFNYSYDPPHVYASNTNDVWIGQATSNTQCIEGVCWKYTYCGGELIEEEPLTPGDPEAVNCCPAFGDPTEDPKGWLNSLIPNTTAFVSVNDYPRAGASTNYQGTESETRSQVHSSDQEEASENFRCGSFLINNVFPNPTNRNLNLNIFNYKASDQTGAIRIVSSLGELVFEQKVQIQPGNSIIEVNLPEQMVDGIYQLLLTDDRGGKCYEKFVKINSN